MHVVILVHSLIGGGAERVAALWATGFVERGFDVTVITQSLTSERYDVSPKVNIINIPFITNNKAIFRLSIHLGIVQYNYNKKLSRILHTIKPEICIGVMGQYARDAYVMTRDIGTFVIQTYHNSFELPETAHIIRKRDLSERFIKDKDVPARTVLTQVDKDYIGNRMKNVYVMPNPLAYSPLMIVPKKEKIIMACGRLDVWDVKGFDVLIKAWKKIAFRHLDWRLIIVGSGSNNSLMHLQSLANKSNVKVEFIGFQTNIEELYAKSEIFVLSSRFEGFGMVLIEAMSQGCACIACDYKGRQKEIINEEDLGLLCAPDNESELANSLEKMISDSNYRILCQNKSLKRASYYSLDQTMKRWETIFKDLGIYS